MSKRSKKLATSSEVEETFVKLFNRIDDSVNHYIGSAENGLLKQQAMRNAVGMLEILKAIYKNDLQLRSL